MAVVKCSIELGNYIHLSNYVQKAESTPEAQVGWRGARLPPPPPSRKRPVLCWVCALPRLVCARGEGGRLRLRRKGGGALVGGAPGMACQVYQPTLQPGCAGSMWTLKRTRLRMLCSYVQAALMGSNVLAHPAAPQS